MSGEDIGIDEICQQDKEEENAKEELHVWPKLHWQQPKIGNRYLITKKDKIMYFLTTVLSQQTFHLSPTKLQKIIIASTQVCKYESMPESMYANMQVFKYACMQVGKYASMQVCKYASMRVCKYSSMQPVLLVLLSPL